MDEGRDQSVVAVSMCGLRPDHLWEQIDDGEGWRCVYCSRITDDPALVRVGRQMSDHASSQTPAVPMSLTNGHEPPSHDGPCTRSHDPDGKPLRYCAVCFQDMP